MSRSEAFWALAKGEPDECWIWPLRVGSHGYGHWSEPLNPSASAATTAPRCAFFYANGRWPNVVRHRCPGGPDKRCVNPAHLVDGTHKLNALDRIADGAQPRGEAVGVAVLTAEHVAAARVLRKTDPASWTIDRLARMFGVNITTMRPAVHGDTWKHVEEAPAAHVESWTRGRRKSA